MHSDFLHSNKMQKKGEGGGVTSIDRTDCVESFLY